MILKNKRTDLIYKGIDNVVMIHDSLKILLDANGRILYAFISNFEYGIDIEYIYDLMEPKGWTREILDANINHLLGLEFIESVIDVDLEKMKLDFERFKKSLNKI